MYVASPPNLLAKSCIWKNSYFLKSSKCIYSCVSVVAEHCAISSEPVSAVAVYSFILMKTLCYNVCGISSEPSCNRSPYNIARYLQIIILGHNLFDGGFDHRRVFAWHCWLAVCSQCRARVSLSRAHEQSSHPRMLSRRHPLCRNHEHSVLQCMWHVLWTFLQGIAKNASS